MNVLDEASDRASENALRWREIVAIWDELNDDEHRVLVSLANRLLAGRRCYGPLDLANDPRDWMKERKAEIEDLLVYTAFEALKRENG